MSFRNLLSYHKLNWELRNIWTHSISDHRKFCSAPSETGLYGCSLRSRFRLSSPSIRAAPIRVRCRSRDSRCGQPRRFPTNIRRQRGSRSGKLNTRFLCPNGFQIFNFFRSFRFIKSTLTHVRDLILTHLIMCKVSVRGPCLLRNQTMTSIPTKQFNKKQNKIYISC